MSRTNIIFLVALLSVPLSGICIDLYTPSLPAITNFFHTEKTYVQITISAFLIGFSLFQLVAGPLVDSLGRRKPLIIALLTNAAIAFAIPYLPSIDAFIAVRVLQGMSVAISSVAARSIIIDLYSHTGEAFLKKMSMATIAWGLGPVVAPAIGGYIQHFLSWQANFYAMTFYLLLIGLGALLFVPETQERFQSLHPKAILKNYLMILKNKKFLAYGLSAGPMWGSLVLFATEGPFIIQTTLKHSPVVFGNIALCAGIVWLIGASICRSIIHSCSNKIFYGIFFCGLFFSAVLVVSGLMGYFNLWWVAIPTVLVIGVASFIFTNHAVTAMTIFPKEISGSTNAMSFSIISAGVMFVSALGSIQKAQSQIPLGITYFLIMLFALMLFYFFLKKPHHE